MNKGFTLIEITITLGIFAMLLALPTVFFYGIGRANSLEQAARDVNNTLGEAQLDSINGRSVDGVSPTSYGVYFGNTYFVRFSDTSYNPDAATNERVDLPSGITFSSINLPNDSVEFARVTGAVSNFDTTLHTFVLRDSNTDREKTVTISRFGAVAIQ